MELCSYRDNTQFLYISIECYFHNSHKKAVRRASVDMRLFRIFSSKIKQKKPPTIVLGIFFEHPCGQTQRLFKSVVRLILIPYLQQITLFQWSKKRHFLNNDNYYFILADQMLWASLVILVYSRSVLRCCIYIRTGLRYTSTMKLKNLSFSYRCISFSIYSIFALSCVTS